jgi:rfaE bifunctional protein nucleotidyltransferase chain/domain
MMQLTRLLQERARWRRQGAVVVFTNGCFDLLHPGHVQLLQHARRQGDVLVVGLNSDASVRAIKGPSRPVVAQDARAAVIGALACVDAVTVFDEPTPARLIAALEPDVLVKGGDWPLDQIVGAELVRERGGRVLSLPLVPGYSTTGLVERLTSGLAPSPAPAPGDPRLAGLVESIRVKDRLLAECGEAIVHAAQRLADTLLDGGKVLLFGNGGSAAEAQHIAAELVGRFQHERRALPALALTADTSALTALGNDYGWERVFARQIEALASPGDAVVALSTSGTSANVLAGATAARARKCIVLGITGARGTRLAGLCDAAVLVPSTETARIQEASLTIGHLWCEIVDDYLGAAREP